MDQQTDMPETVTETPPQPDHLEGGAFDWCVVEIFGHRRHAGRGREEDRFGIKILRIDVPIKGDVAANGWETHYYGGSSIFSFTLSDEATVMRMNKPYELPARYRLPAPDPDEAESGDEELSFGGDEGE